MSWEFWRDAGVEDVRAELDCGANIKARADLGWTPLHQAAAFSNEPSVVTLLLDHGADIEARADRGRTPLHAAAANSGEPAVVAVLLDHGADVGAKTNDGETPLHQAVINGKAIARCSSARPRRRCRGEDRRTDSPAMGCNYREPVGRRGTARPRRRCRGEDRRRLDSITPGGSKR